MKKMLMCVIFGVSVSAWASNSQIKCQALLTSEGLLNSASQFRSEISEIVSSTVPVKFDELKIKISWGFSGLEIVRQYMINAEDLSTHQSLPQIPNPADWPRHESFNFAIVVQGISKENSGLSIQNYKIHRWSSENSIKFSLV